MFHYPMSSVALVGNVQFVKAAIAGLNSAPQCASVRRLSHCICRATEVTVLTLTTGIHAAGNHKHELV
jgi:hypothetical protein